MQNKVTLLEYGGSDKTHALAAWSSTFLDLDTEIPASIDERVDSLIDAIKTKGGKVKTPEQLIAWLMDPSHDMHTSPFRASFFMFATTNDIATHIQFLKHAVAMQAENAESARYKELKEDKYYLPRDWLEYGEVGNTWYKELIWVSELSNRRYHDCLKDLIDAGMPKERAKETARYFKLYNSQINSTKMFSFDGLMQVYFKRQASKGAQKEISDMVTAMVEEVKNIPGNPFKASLEAFGVK